MARCADGCGYYWQEKGEVRPSCHYQGPEEWAPCAQEEEHDWDERYAPSMLELNPQGFFSLCKITLDKCGRMCYTKRAADGCWPGI